MKRALVVLLVVGLLGTLGFAQTLSGRWRLHGYIEDLQTPSIKLRSDILINYNVSGWTFSAYGLFTQSGLSLVYLGATAPKDSPFNFSGTMYFTGADYLFSTFEAGLSLAGVGFDLLVWHDAGDYGPLTSDDLGFSDVYPYWTLDIEGAKMVYYLKLMLPPVRADIIFTDTCTGISFNQALLQIKGLTFCCDYTAWVGFSKANGFDYLRFSFADFSICCGWKFDVDITFQTNSKTLAIYPKYGPLESCLVLYGGPVWDATDKEFDGWDFHGFSCKVTLQDCYTVGFLTAFNPEFFFTRWRGTIRLFPGVASGFTYNTMNPKPTWWSSYWRDLFLSCTVGDVKTFVENEVFWFTACGAGCCGGQWKLEVDVFSNFDGDPGLFGITRIDALLNVPVMANLVVDFYISVAKLDCTVPSCTPSGIRALGGGFTLNF